MLSLMDRINAHKTDVDGTFNHIETVFNTITQNCGRGKIFLLADTNRLVEGLFLNMWAKWETSCKYLFLLDLSYSPSSVLCSEVKKFRTIRAPFRLAEFIVNHPDSSRYFIEWSNFNVVKERSKALLGDNNRFTNPQISSLELQRLRIIRNAVAHKSDRAREQFLNLIKDTPFTLSKNQCQGINVGRFLNTIQWDGISVFEKALSILRDNLTTLCI